MKKSFLFVFEVLFLSMVFISCSEFFISSLKETSNGLQNEGETQTAGLQTVKITLSLPSALASNDSLSERTVTASSLTLNYKVLATASGQNPVTADSNSNNANLELTLKEGCTWTITVKAYTATDTNYANVILQGATTVNVVGGLGVTIPLCIYTDTDASTGKIFLALAAGNNSFTKYSYKFTNHDDNSFYSGTSSTATNGVLAPKDFLALSSNKNISIDNVKSGTYRLTIWFYDDNGYLVYVLSTGVNVYPTLTTNTWSGETADDSFTLSTAMVASQKSLTLYVCGSDDSNNSKISFYGTSSGILSGKYQTPSDSNSGGAYSPLATVAAAVKKCTVSNNTYTIFVDGTTYENSYINVDTCNINISSLGTDKATIKRNFTKADSVINVTEFNTLNMTNIILDGNKDASGYYFPNNGGGIKNTGTVSLNNCTIQNCKATYGNGIYQGGSLNIGGDTYIESSSDIFLNDKTLNVTSNLTYNAPFVATITPNNYSLATITVGSNLALAEVTKKIAITTPSNTWI